MRDGGKEGGLVKVLQRNQTNRICVVIIRGGLFGEGIPLASTGAQGFLETLCPCTGVEDEIKECS
jgi:hypothetical protein